MYTVAAFVAPDRLNALAEGKVLPEQVTGSILFADISGFTSLTEAMVDHFGEKDAVDRLTVQINRVFTALIDLVERFNGVVVGFGGDALTCWFQADTGLRAVECAQTMQAQMPQFEAIQVGETKNIALSLKIGITSGTVRRVVIGEPNIQLFDVLAGRPINDLRVVLAQIKAGEVRVSASVLQQLREKAVFTMQEVSEQVQQPIGIVEQGRSSRLAPIGTTTLPAPNTTKPLQPQALKSWLLPPVYERVINGQGRFLNDIRPVVVLFLQFNGLDFVNDIDVNTKLDVYVRWVQQIVTRYHGFVIKLTIDDKGSYLLATFGAPVTNEADDEHAALAAIELRLSPVEFPFISSVQIGIHRGQRILAGAFGSDKRLAYDLLGSAANLANRLMTNAASNQILVTKRIVASTFDKFTYGEPTLTPLKGINEPIYLYELVDQLPPAQTYVDFSASIIGRDDEIKQISQLLVHIVSSQGHLLVIEGEAGVGKSRLAAAVLEQALPLGCKIISGICDRVNQQTSYYPWRQIVRSQQPRHNQPPQRPIDPLLLELLGMALPVVQAVSDWDPERRQEEIFRRLSDLLLKEAQNQPLVLVLEDVQWMDKISQAFLTIFARLLTQVPILVVLTLRPDENWYQELAKLERHAQLRRLQLNGLPQDGMQTLIQQLLQGTIQPLILNIIEQRAQGNPFYAEELVLALRETEMITYQPGADKWVSSETLFVRLQQANCLHKEPNTGEWTIRTDAPLATVDLGAPEKLHQLVLSRIDRLPEACRQTIYAASVIGSVFTLELLAQAGNEHIQTDELAMQLVLLQKHQLVSQPAQQGKTTYAFRHHITQEVTYDSMVEALRQELHHAVGLSLERSQPDAVELLAYHFSRAHQRAKSLHYLGTAAARAQHEYANQSALNYYNQALALEVRAEWLLGKVEVAHNLGLRAVEQETLSLLQHWSTVSAYTVAYLWAQFYEAASDYPMAEREIEQALTDSPIPPTAMAKARCWTLLGLAARRVGNYNEAKTWSTKALRLLDEAAPHGDASGIRINLYNNLGFAHLQQGNYEQTITYGERALTLCRAIGHRKGEAEALTSLVLAAYYRRDFAMSLQLAQQAIQIQRTIGDLTGEGTSLYNLALSQYELARYEEASQNCQTALQIHQTTLNRREETNVRNLLGYLYYLQGNLTDGLNEIQSALYLARTINDEASEAYLLGNLGMLLRDHGRLRQAAQYLGESIAIAKRQGDKYVIAMGQSHLAIVYLYEGNHTEALRLAISARQIRQEIGADALTTIDLTTAAQAYWALDKHKQALEQVEQALQLLEQSTDHKPEFPQRDYFICYQILQQANKMPTAKAALENAYAILIQQAQGFRQELSRQAFLTHVPHNRAIIEAYQLERVMHLTNFANEGLHEKNNRHNTWPK